MVLLLALALLVFEIIAPDTDWTRSISLAFAAAALIVAVATSRARRSVRRMRAFAAGGIAIAVLVCVAVGAFSASLTFLAITLTLASIPVALVGGLLRLARDRGVTIQAVAGGLAIYLLVGLLFASVIGVVSRAESGAYFAGHAAASNGDRVYFSFTVLTTTGFGDYTPAHPVGHALSVLEMLTGQLYLVTVIGILVGNYAGRRMRADHPVTVTTRNRQEE